MSKKVLVTLPQHDVETSYLSYWVSDVCKTVVSCGHILLERRKERANRRHVVSSLRSQRPGLVLLNGHGSASAVCVRSS